MNFSRKDILISKWVTGELTEAESIELAKWRASQPSFEPELDTAKGIWDASASYESDIVSTDTSWSDIAQAINTKPVKPKSRILTFPMKVAASLVLLMGAWFLAKNYLPTAQHLQIASADVSNEKFQLADGSTIWLKKGATLSYPDQFTQQKRKVKLSGEAFFDIAKSDVPFIIETQTGEVTVLGTSFEVESSKSRTEVTVTTGKVKLTSAQSGKSVNIQPHEIGLHDVTTQQLSLKKTDNLNDLAWHTGKFMFNNTSLAEVVSKLSDHFGTKIIIQDADMRICKYTSPLTNPDLNTTIETIAKTFSFDIARSTNRIVLENGECQ